MKAWRHWCYVCVGKLCKIKCSTELIGIATNCMIVSSPKSLWLLNIRGPWRDRMWLVHVIDKHSLWHLSCSRKSIVISIPLGLACNNQESSNLFVFKALLKHCWTDFNLLETSILWSCLSTAALELFLQLLH